MNSTQILGSRLSGIRLEGSRPCQGYWRGAWDRTRLARQPARGLALWRRAGLCRCLHQRIERRIQRSCNQDECLFLEPRALTSLEDSDGLGIDFRSTGQFLAIPALAAPQPPGLQPYKSLPDFRRRRKLVFPQITPLLAATHGAPLTATGLAMRTPLPAGRKILRLHTVRAHLSSPPGFGEAPTRVPSGLAAD